MSRSNLTGMVLLAGILFTCRTNHDLPVGGARGMLEPENDRERLEHNRRLQAQHQSNAESVSNKTASLSESPADKAEMINNSVDENFPEYSGEDKGDFKSLDEDELDAIREKVREKLLSQESAGGEEVNQPAIEEEVDESKLEASIAEDTEEIAEPELKKSQILPIVHNKYVDKWVKKFTGKSKKLFGRYVARGAPYKNTIQKILADKHLPKEIYYLAMIESGFSHYIKSHASAVGFWQFIKGTGKRYGLRIDRSVDERHDPIRSTLAAAEYLKDLYRVFQDWNLAMAAYNAGERRVLSGIMRATDRDYWNLVETRKLPRETRDYVAKVYAAATIGENLEKYGFTQPSYPEAVHLDVAYGSSRQSLKSIAAKNSVPYSLVKALNPHLRSAKVPPTRRSYKVWIPSKSNASDRKFTELIEVTKPALAKARKTSSSSASSTESYTVKHKVRRGDTLAGLARKYGSTWYKIRKANPGKVRRNRIYVGTWLKIPTKNAPIAAASSSGKSRVHLVRRGENLARIARKYSVSVEAITALNQSLVRNPNKIFRGQRLTIPAAGADKVIKYEVRRGDSLHKIASKFGTSISEIKKMNRLSRNRIYVGQSLLVSL